MIKSPRTFKAVELSTSHLEEEVAQQIDEWLSTGFGPGDLIIYPKSEYGWFIPITDEIDLMSLPYSLAYVISTCLVMEAEWIIFDRDVEIAEYLPYYDW
ncbi:MAG: hypothetical protein IJ880_03725 [Bacilli bacterium]|nr:hypothetical protein [Bacilli bacterium]MBR3119796.1 hypothetical protein [Oceanobacillus sp.]